MSAIQVAAKSRRIAIIGRASAIGWVSFIAGTICVLFVLVAIFAPLIAPHDPLAIDPYNSLAHPSQSHWLGTDESGRDILSRLIYGARSSLTAPTVIILVSTVSGTAYAFIAGWAGGALDAVMARILDLIFSFPGLLVAVAASTVFGAGFWAPIVALSIAYAAGLARILRPTIKRECSLPYVAALRLQGATGLRICGVHIVPNVASYILVQAAITFGYAMIDVAGLAYLGLGIQPPTPDWGVMASDGQSAIAAGAPEQSLFASLAVALVVVSFNLVGERLARHFELGDAA